MTNNSDLQFITNEGEQNLLERFKVLIKNTATFDVLVGYFYSSAFHTLYKSLERTEKIRILVGIATDKETYDLVEQSKRVLSHSDTKNKYSDGLINEMEKTEDSHLVEEGIGKFLEWLKSGKLEIRAYSERIIHAKLYVMTFDKDDRDTGRVITGSSNFSRSGMEDNLELNIELKGCSDYDFANKKFNELWEDAVDLGDTYQETIMKETWLNDTISPYHLYLKFLYEYFQDELSNDNALDFDFTPKGFMKLEYQEQAVLNAKRILDEYGGVLIADVVGLGKTYMVAMLMKQLHGKVLVLAPPRLLDEDNPGSWRQVFYKFHLSAKFESISKLDACLEGDMDDYKYVIIDEAHRFRNEKNQSYEKLTRICRGKGVILVTATPLNNTPADILSLIKFFQSPKNSTIPNLPDLDSFFKSLERNIKGLDRKKDKKEYLRITQENAKSIRESVLKYLIVRRTRKEVMTYFANDLQKQDFKFPDVENPEPVFYQFNKDENKIFNQTVEMLAKKIIYARYKPMQYYIGDESLGPLSMQGQTNIAGFMKTLLIKRLESSFYAFRKSVARFVARHKQFIKQVEAGHVYVSKGYSEKLFDLLDNGEDDLVWELLVEDKARSYSADDFKPEFITDLKSDLETLQQIEEMWQRVKRDPKLLAFEDMLNNNNILKQNKLIVFTESKETAEYLVNNIKAIPSQKILEFTGSSDISRRKTMIENFDARYHKPKDDYRILVSTEVLSEGVNLHRSNVVINYDIPWNPTRLMQRVGRINRVDSKFEKIYSFNFFPTETSNDEIKLKEAAITKIQSFITLLGADAQLLTDGEVIESHELFNHLISKKTITGEDEEYQSELKYLQIIRDISNKSPDLYKKIKLLPKKARTAKKYKDDNNKLLTYFRKGKAQKFFISDENNSEELDFVQSASLLESDEKIKRQKIPGDFYTKLKNNKEGFNNEMLPEIIIRAGKDNANEIIKIIKAMIKDTRQFTKEEEEYLTKVKKHLQERTFPQYTTKSIINAFDKEFKNTILDESKLLSFFKEYISVELLTEHKSEMTTSDNISQEVILSEYLISD